MDKSFWNNRYVESEFAYGKEPNDFLKAQSEHFGKKVLCLAEGEGRNAVYLAMKGADVTCIDYAEEGLKKAIRLATEKGVQLATITADLRGVELEKDKWDTIVIIFGHFPPELRIRIHSQIYGALRTGGRLILEAYHKDQINFKTGGPMQLEMLYSKEELEKDFMEFNKLECYEVIREVNEGAFHHGKAAVIQVIGYK